MLWINTTRPPRYLSSVGDRGVILNVTPHNLAGGYAEKARWFEENLNKYGKRYEPAEFVGFTVTEVTGGGMIDIKCDQRLISGWTEGSTGLMDPFILSENENVWLHNALKKLEAKNMQDVTRAYHDGSVEAAMIVAFCECAEEYTTARMKSASNPALERWMIFYADQFIDAAQSVEAVTT